MNLTATVISKDDLSEISEIERLPTLSDDEYLAFRIGTFDNQHYVFKILRNTNLAKSIEYQVAKNKAKREETQ